MKAFDNHAVEIKGLTLEHNAAGVAIFGSLDIPRSLEGLQVARQLSEELAEIVGSLQNEEKDGILPAISQKQYREFIQNPFR